MNCNEYSMADMADIWRIYGGYGGYMADIWRISCRHNKTLNTRLAMRRQIVYAVKHTPRLLDKISMKNTETAFIADGRSKKHPRRAVLGPQIINKAERKPNLN